MDDNLRIVVDPHRVKNSGASTEKLLKMKFNFLHWFLLSAVLGLLSSAQARPAADLIVTNANIYTVDKQQPQAAAMAIIGDRFAAVGTSADIDQWRGPNTKIINVAGKIVLPGFNDSHVHFSDAGAALDQVQLNDATTPEEFVRRIAAQAAKTAKGDWIVGGGWDETKWPNPVLPTKDMIDSVTPETPVAINRYDGHQVLANSLGMKLAGISANTPDVPGGVIVRDAKGNPRGNFKDAAQTLITKAIPPMSHNQRMRAAKRALELAASVGVTSVQQMSNGVSADDYADIAAYSELQERGELTARIYMAPIETGWADQAKIGLRHAWGSSYLRVGALKGYADGSLGSGTAYMYEGFSDEPNNKGILSDEMHPVEGMRDRLTKADAAGLQICVHAIGDQGISMILDIFDSIEKANGYHDQRFRIEHAQHMAPKDFERFEKLHVIASMQPYHAIDDGRWAERRLGHERARYSYAWRSMLDHHVTLAFGTDCPVAPLNPMLGLYAAVTRATLDGKNPKGWIPEEKITLPEAIEAYTMGSSYAEFQEKEKGSITPGKLADFVVLSDDIFRIGAEAIRNVKIETTVVGGKVVYRAVGKPNEQ